MPFTYLKTTHSYHLVDPSPWPIISAFGAFMLTVGGVLYMYKFNGGWVLFIAGFILILYTNKHHFGFESAIWYWHFVDVVWLFLFTNIYWWSSK